MKRWGSPFSLVGLAACFFSLPAAVAGAQAAMPGQPVGPEVVTFSPDSPVPAGISPEAKAYFLRQRPLPGVRPVMLPDPTDPAQRPAFLQYREMDRQYWEGAGRSVRIPFAKQDANIDGVNATWITTLRTGRRGKVILFLHGGAYVFGSAHAGSSGMIALADRTGVPILAVDYRLAPEAPFPAGLEDVKRVYRGLLRRGYLAKNIVILGEDAGGGLALAATLSLREEGTPLPAALVLLSPWADLTRSGDTAYTLAAHSPLCWEADLASPAKAYAGNEDPHNPLISPVYADYTGMPPMLVHAGTRDILLSDATRITHEALKAGVDATLDVWEGMFHLHHHAGLPESAEAMADVADYIQTRLR